MSNISRRKFLKGAGVAALAVAAAGVLAGCSGNDAPAVPGVTKKVTVIFMCNGATAGKFDLAKRAKAASLDAIHDTVHEMAKDEARHGRGMQGLLDRYFK